MTHRFNPTILREYDIRGIVGSTLTEADAYALGRTYAALAKDEGAAVRSCAVVVGAFDGAPLASILASHALAHAADVLQRERVGDAVPDGPTLARELVERVGIRVGLENPVIGHYSISSSVFPAGVPRGAVLNSPASPCARCRSRLSPSAPPS